MHNTMNLSTEFPDQLMLLTHQLLVQLQSTLKELQSFFQFRLNIVQLSLSDKK
jgi:hypothetical protein